MKDNSGRGYAPNLEMGSREIRRSINVKPGPVKTLIVMQIKYALRECNVTPKKKKRGISPKKREGRVNINTEEKGRRESEVSQREGRKERMAWELDGLGIIGRVSHRHPMLAGGSEGRAY